MSLQHESFSRHADVIRCDYCGKIGSVIWEDVHRLSGRTKELIRIDGSFYERIAKKAPHSIELARGI